MITIEELAPRIRSGNLGRSVANEYRRRRGQQRRLLKRPLHKTGWAVSASRLNTVARTLGSTSYLEIGVRRGHTLENVAVQRRVGVDPFPLFDTEHLPAGTSFFHGPSDPFFEQLSSRDHFDLIFLDGLHTFEQTYRDLLNALDHLSPRAVILIDDVVPTDEVAAIPSLEESQALRQRAGDPSTAWQGDVWKVVVAMSGFHPELEFRTIVGSGNPQALVWRAQAPAPNSVVLRDVIENVASRSFGETFAAGVPPTFRPVEDSVAFRDCFAAFGAPSSY